MTFLTALRLSAFSILRDGDVKSLTGLSGFREVVRLPR